MSDQPVNTSSFQLPNAVTVDTVYVQLPDGRIVPRRKDEVILRPTPPTRGKE